MLFDEPPPNILPMALAMPPTTDPTASAIPPTTEPTASAIPEKKPPPLSGSPAELLSELFPPALLLSDGPPNMLPIVLAMPVTTEPIVETIPPTTDATAPTAPENALPMAPPILPSAKLPKKPPTPAATEVKAPLMPLKIELPRLEKPSDMFFTAPSTACSAELIVLPTKSETDPTGPAVSKPASRALPICPNIPDLL
ncbi:MAG: hypothetical protein NXI27_00185 [Alphaproteobacteria bacterium]|nr:hypothetical protein [Alphaproteobacteria bacterium]